MERFTQFRDRGSGIAPFLPLSSEPSSVPHILRYLLFFVRLPLVLTAVTLYLLFASWLPVGPLGRKAGLWVILLLAGIWWEDLRIDGVKRGSLAMQKLERLPHPGSVIVSSFTSPIDCLYLAAVFDPVFTASYPHTKLVERISLLRAVLRAFMPPTLTPSNSANLVQLSDLIARYSNTCIVVFPECTTTNGRAILTLSSKAVSVPSDIHIFPINIRYTPARVLTPVPYAYTSFLWKLLSNPKHCIRVRLAASMSSPNVCHSEEKERTMQPPTKGNTNRSQLKLSGINIKEIAGHSTSKAEAEKFSTELADTLARLGRVPRVALSVKDKEEFYRLWSRENK